MRRFWGRRHSRFSRSPSQIAPKLNIRWHLSLESTFQSDFFKKVPPCKRSDPLKDRFFFRVVVAHQESVQVSKLSNKACIDDMWWWLWIRISFSSDSALSRSIKMHRSQVISFFFVFAVRNYVCSTELWKDSTQLTVTICSRRIFFVVRCKALPSGAKCHQTYKLI